MKSSDSLGKSCLHISTDIKFRTKKPNYKILRHDTARGQSSGVSGVEWSVVCTSSLLLWVHACVLFFYLFFYFYFFHFMVSAKDLISHALSNRWVVQWSVMREHAVPEREKDERRKT